MFVAGVLLRRLLSDSNLQDVSHVVVDEVHERSADSDLLLMLLRQLLSQPGARNLRVLLMSATADAHAFADYFRATVVCVWPTFNFHTPLRACSCHPAGCIHIFAALRRLLQLLKLCSSACYNSVQHASHMSVGPPQFGEDSGDVHNAGLAMRHEGQAGLRQHECACTWLARNSSLLHSTVTTLVRLSRPSPRVNVSLNLTCSCESPPPATTPLSPPPPPPTKGCENTLMSC